MGAGNFGGEIVIENNTDRIQSVEIADMDNDNDMDLVYSYKDLNGNSLTFWGENDGNANFTQHTVGNQMGYFIELADTDNDGDKDIISVDTFNETKLFINAK